MLNKIYTETQLWSQTDVNSLSGLDLIVFDLSKPNDEGFVLYGFDEVGEFTEGMKKPRYKFVKL